MSVGVHTRVPEHLEFVGLATCHAHNVFGKPRDFGHVDAKALVTGPVTHLIEHSQLPLLDLGLHVPV